MTTLRKIAEWSFNNATAVLENQKEYSHNKLWGFVKEAIKNGYPENEIIEAIKIGESKDINKVFAYICK